MCSVSLISMSFVVVFTNVVVVVVVVVLPVGQNGCVSPAPAARSGPRGLRPGPRPHHEYESTSCYGSTSCHFLLQVKTLHHTELPFFPPGPPGVTDKPTEPPGAPTLDFTGPPTTLAPTIISLTTTTNATTSPVGEEDVRPTGPDGAGRLLPVPAPSPPASSDAPQAPPPTEPPTPPPPAPEGSGNETFATDAPPTPDYGDEGSEATMEPGMGITSDTTPHGECGFI